MSRPHTRMALLASRSQLALARQGQELLEQKRDALLEEFYRDVGIVFAAHEELAAVAGAARFALDVARVRAGSDVVASAAIPSAGTVTIDIDWSTVMGVPVPVVVSRPLAQAPADRGRAIEASGPALELAAERFETELAVAIRVATIEARVHRLAREIRRTSSRVNALRTRVVPVLSADIRATTFVLEHREREDRCRLKRVKARRGAAKAR
ncbi:MAG: V-type ATP synthase subunit D [Chloroflexota bacterium]